MCIHVRPAVWVTIDKYYSCQAPHALQLVTPYTWVLLLMMMMNNKLQHRAACNSASDAAASMHATACTRLENSDKPCRDMQSCTCKLLYEPHHAHDQVHLRPKTQEDTE